MCGNSRHENYEEYAILLAAKGATGLVERLSKSGFAKRGLKQLGKLKVQFGQTHNQVEHTFRHTDSLGISRNILKSNVEKHLDTVAKNIVSGKPFNQIIYVNGKKIQYTAYKLENNVINIGRIHGIS